MRASRKRTLVALTLRVLPVGVLPVAGCGDYSLDRGPGAGVAGATTSTGQLNTAGQTPTGGAAGSASLAGMGGSSPATSGAGGNIGGSSVPVEASCNSVVPCGGDVVGTWVVAGSCLPVSGEANMAGFGLGCTAAPVTGELEVAGAWTVNADGTFMDATTTSGASEIELPASCLNVSGTVTTCDRLDGALQALGYSSVTCADSASGGCTCAATAQQTGGMAVLVLGAPTGGTYTASNNVFAVQGRSPTEYAYCVSGGTLTMTPQGTSKTGTLMGTIVLQKR